MICSPARAWEQSVSDILPWNVKVTTSVQILGAENPWGAEQSPADGVWAREQAENCAGRGAARGEWVLKFYHLSHMCTSGGKHALNVDNQFWRCEKAHICYCQMNRTTNSHRARLHRHKQPSAVLTIFLSSWFRYEERAPDSPRQHQNTGWADPEKTEEWVLVNNRRTPRSFMRSGLVHTHHFSSGIEPKKGEDDEKYVPINIRMQRTQVSVDGFVILSFHTWFMSSLFHWWSGKYCLYINWKRGKDIIGFTIFPHLLCKCGENLGQNGKDPFYLEKKYCDCFYVRSAGAGVNWLKMNELWL